MFYTCIYHGILRTTRYLSIEYNCVSQLHVSKCRVKWLFQNIKQLQVCVYKCVHKCTHTHTHTHTGNTPRGSTPLSMVRAFQVLAPLTGTLP